MTNSVTENEHEQERSVRQAIEARLNPGERLVAYTTGKLYGVTAPAFHIGLTGERLLFLPVKRGKPAADAYGIQRDRLESLKLRGSGVIASQLEVKLPNDQLDFRIQSGRWSRRAKALARWEPPPTAALAGDPSARGEQHLRQAYDFRALGLTGLAQDELLAAERANPMLAAQPAALQALRAQLAETRLAWRVAAGFLFGHVAVVALLTGFLMLLGGLLALHGFWDLEVLISIVISLWFGLQLWRGQRQARINTVYATVAGLILFGLLPLLLEGNLLALIQQAAFSGSLWLVLAGEGQRARTWAAIAIYAVGYLGLVALLLPVSVLAALVAGH